MNSPVLYIVDADPVSRDAVAGLMKYDGYDTAEFASAEDFLANFEDDPSVPRCLITDLFPSARDGQGLQEQIIARHIRMPVIIVTSHPCVPSAVMAMKRGAIDYLEKPLEPRRLLECVQTALERDATACQHQASRRDVAQRMAKLTPREREVLDLLVTAHSTKEIAVRLNINSKTVFVHRARVMEKMGVDSLVELSRLVSGCGVA